MLKLTGYSERGLINSLFYEMYYSQNPEKILEDFLLLTCFPAFNDLTFVIDDAEILIEQSFSDFGDADVLLLLNNGVKNISIFIEAKVRKSWNIQTQYQKFLEGTMSKVSSSNLFTQFYHKLRLVNAIKAVGITGLQAGIDFPLSSSKPTRKIGSNLVVLKSVEKLSRYLDETYYCAILPGLKVDLDKFYREKLLHINLNNYPEWDTTNYGYVTWQQIEIFWKKFYLKNTAFVFKHNKNQIY